MFGPERLEAIEVRVTCAEFSRTRMEVGNVANPCVPRALRDLATWHVAAHIAPADFSDSIILRLVPR